MDVRPLDTVETASLFRELHEKLIALLAGLGADDRNLPTAAGSWRVRDVVAHLLAATGERVSEFVRSLDPVAPALYPVAWAGETTSPNWMDTGREYAERWHHQMQIRSAVSAPLLDDRRWMRPVLELSVRAVPVALATTEAEPGSAVVRRVLGDAGGAWTLRRGEREREAFEGAIDSPTASVETDADTASRMYFNGLTPDMLSKRVRVEGAARLAAAVLRARDVMV